MEKTKLDRQQDFLLRLLHPLVYLWMWKDAKRIVHRDPAVDFRRKEPFVMLANHTFMFDVVHVPLPFRNVPFIIASQTLFTKQPAKFFVTQVAHVIAKAKGRSDILSIKNIFNAVRKGYPILIFPEGDTTFYGETGLIEESTMKLIRKLGLDVITCNVKGGYLSKPRWATAKRRRRQIELDYRLEIPKENLATMSEEAIGAVIRRALSHNDYEYQRQKMIPHPGTRLAEGLENVVYVCPHCQSLHTIQTEKNLIRCVACGKEGFVDPYGFLHGFVFDNLIDWDAYQRGFSEPLRNSVVSSEGTLSFMNREDGSQTIVGIVQLLYQDQTLRLTGARDEWIPIAQVTNTTITLRCDLGFLFQERHYILHLQKSGAAFLRILQDKY